MKRLSLALGFAVLVVMLVASIPPLLTRTVLVSSSVPTAITATTGRTSFVVQNVGPNPEWCQLGGDGGTLAAGTGIRLDANGGSWGQAEREGWPIWCLATTADQVSGAGTVINETR